MRLSRRPSRLPALLQDVGLDQKLNAQLPLELTFKDEQGRSGEAGRLLRQAAGDPDARLLRVPDALHAGAERTDERDRRAELLVGQEFDIVTVSFDPRETPELAQAKKASYLERYKRAGAGSGWHFLTGTQHSIESLTRARRVPVRLQRRAWISTRTRAASWCSTPDGRLSHYFYGIEYGAARSAAGADRGL